MRGPRRQAFRFLVMVVFFGIGTEAALGATELSKVSYYSLGIRDGLANNSVYCVLQDSAGLMWFGTFGGLSRWDGENFRNYRPKPGEPSLAASVIFALLEDGDSLWIGTDGGGLSRFDRRAETFTTWRASPLQANKLSSDRILALGRDKEGMIWAGSGDGLVNIIDPRTGLIHRLTPPILASKEGARAPIRCLAPAPDGGMWVGTEGDGLHKVSPEGTIKVYRHNSEDISSIGSDTIRSLLVDSRGWLWAGLGGGGVDLERDGTFVHARAKGSRLLDQAVRSLAEDGSGAVWVGWAEAGLGLLDPATLEIGMPSSSEAAMVRVIYRDRSGLMWIGFKDGGLRAYNLGSSIFSRFPSMANGVRLKDLRGLAERKDGSILAGSDGLGLLAIDPRRAEVVPVPGMPQDGPALKVYAVLVARDGTEWCGTDGGGLIARRPDGRILRYRHEDKRPGSLSADVVWCIHEDGDGTLWVGMEAGGLDRLDPGASTFVHFRPDPLSATTLRGASVRCIFRDSKSRLWIGTWDGGLSRLEADGRTFASYGPTPGRRDSLGDASVNVVFEDSSGSIWVGTGGSGVELLDEELGSFRRFGEEDGLAGSTVYGIVEAKRGELWISTSAGLTRWFVESGESLTYGAEDGLASSEFTQNSWLLARDGRLWFGGPSGLTAFRPSSLSGIVLPPSIVITGIEPHGNGRALREADGSLLLDWRNAGLSFTISVTDYVAPARNRYAMRIQGRDAIWTQLGHINSGYLGPLRPGTWVLAATGANGNGVWSGIGTRLSIRVEAPFWGTPWFIVLVLALLAGAALSIIRYRISTLNARNALLVKFSRHIEGAREEERTGAAREVHDNIGQHLVVLNLQAWWLASHPEAESAERQSRVDEMRSSIDEAMAAVKRMATGFRPVALDSLTFGETLRWYARDFGKRTGLTIATEVMPGLPHFSDEAATALFRVLQEALSNVAHHAGPCSVRITLREDEEAVTLEVVDDGVGMKAGAADAADSFGLIGMRERCSALGGSIAFDGAPGGGTRLFARIPTRRISMPDSAKKQRGAR